MENFKNIIQAIEDKLQAQADAIFIKDMEIKHLKAEIERLKGETK